MATILIVEDDKNLSKMLQEHLTTEGYKVEIAPRGETGADMAAKNPPDLIILDVILPDITGYQLCNRLRIAPETRTVPIIMMSAAAKNENQKAFGLERGANEYIIKPFEISVISAMIRRYIGHKLSGDSLRSKSQPDKDSPSGLARLRAFVDQTLKNPKKED
jgi:two-component system phosphate regulon response regulator PhoB